MGTSPALWNSAVPSGVPCGTSVARKAPIVLTFGGAVDRSSLPRGGLPDGAITSVTFTGRLPSYPGGIFSVADDPALRAGNARRVVFTPSFRGPTGSAVPTTPKPNVAYQVFVPANGGAGTVLTVAVVTTTTSIDVRGGTDTGACGNQAAGSGGAGIIALEDRDGIVSTAFAANPAGAVSAIPTPIASGLTGTRDSPLLRHRLPVAGLRRADLERSAR